MFMQPPNIDFIIISNCFLIKHLLIMFSEANYSFHTTILLWTNKTIKQNRKKIFLIKSNLLRRVQTNRINNNQKCVKTLFDFEIGSNFYRIHFIDHFKCGQIPKTIVMLTPGKLSSYFFFFASFDSVFFLKIFFKANLKMTKTEIETNANIISNVA